MSNRTTDNSQELGRRLAVEVFRNSRASVIMGSLATLIVSYAHIGGAPNGILVAWTSAILTTFIARLLLSYVAERRAADGSAYMPLINLETAIAAMTGLMWSAGLWWLDVGVQDYLFYLRIMVVVGALSFVVSSLTLYLRVFMAYGFSVIVPAMVFFAVTPHVEPKVPWLVMFFLYSVALLTVAFVNNRRSRVAVAGQLKVMQLSEELQDALTSERRALSALSKSAVTDELTGALNRRGVLTDLDNELARCRRFRHGLAVLMIDIDHFKSINDTHGHACGDEALRSVVRALQSMLRTTDILGRFGGEEFLVLLPELDEQGALIAAERLRAKVAANVVEFEGKRLSPTISLGLALHAADETGDRLIARADEALYAAKRNGRNRVELAVSESAAVRAAPATD